MFVSQRLSCTFPGKQKTFGRKFTFTVNSNSSDNPTTACTESLFVTLSEKKNENKNGVGY